MCLVQIDGGNSKVIACLTDRYDICVALYYTTCSVAFILVVSPWVITVLLTFFFQWLDSLLGAYAASFFEAPLSHSDTPHSVGLLWTSDQPVAETSTWQHTTLTRDRHPCPWLDSNPYSQQASGRRPTPWTARPLGSDFVNITLWKLNLKFLWVKVCAYGSGLKLILSDVERDVLICE
jgi:hypothetical protein